MVKMSFAEAGVIATIKVKDGDRVKEGQLLAQLDVGILEKEISISRELLKQKQFKCKKLEELVKAGKATREEFDRVQSDLNIEQFKIERTEAQIRSRSLIAPCDGIVIDIRKDVGESVTPVTVMVLTVVQLNTLVVNMYLPKELLGAMRQGMTKTLYLAEDKISAMVDFVSPITDPSTKTVHVKFSINNAGGHIPSGVRVTLEPPPKSTEPTPTSNTESPNKKAK